MLSETGGLVCSLTSYRYSWTSLSNYRLDGLRMDHSNLKVLGGKGAYKFTC